MGLPDTTFGDPAFCTGRWRICSLSYGKFEGIADG